MTLRQSGRFMGSLFDDILDGRIEVAKVYEDEHVYAFLDYRPLSRGHTVVFPKERKAYLHELSEEAAGALGRVLPSLARAIVRVSGSRHYNVLQNNGALADQKIPHVHFHIIPRIGEFGLGLKWAAKPLDEKDKRLLSEGIRQALSDG